MSDEDGSFTSETSKTKQSNSFAPVKLAIANFKLKVESFKDKMSLSRSKPKVRTKVAKLSPLEPNRLESASSSGSETCVVAQATVSSPQQMSRKGGGGSGGYKMSKFCHECGSKYPVATAKFCVECGVRRLD